MNPGEIGLNSAHKYKEDKTRNKYKSPSAEFTSHQGSSQDY